jgi:DNA invertase Pin-like site-specific DNA recombinase
MQRAGVYDRVSDDKSGRSRSVPQQAAANETVAREQGWRVAARYADPDVSASRFARKDRGDWPRLLADVAAGRLDVVVLWESSRGDRKLTEWSGFLDSCRERGVKIHVTSHERTYDLSRARDWKTLAEEGVSNAYASEETSLRIRRDLADAAALGRPHGRLPYGYVRRYDPVTREYISQDPHPEQADVVREIIGRIAANEPISVLVRDLNTRAVPGPTRGPWARSTVCRMVLEGVVYIARRRHNGGPLLDGAWPPLVEEDVYWRAVRVLRDPERKKQADGRGGIRPGRAKWLLSYVATCGKCSAPLSVQYRPRGGAMVPCYRCSSSAGGCAIAPMAWLDGLVADRVLDWLADESRWKPENADSDAEAVRNEAAAERERLSGFEADAIAGRITSASFARIATGIEARIAELDERARAMSVPAVVRTLVGDGAGGRLWQVDKASTADRRLDMLARWEEMPLAAQRRAVREVCSVALRPSAGVVEDESRVVTDFSKAGRFDPDRVKLS